MALILSLFIACPNVPQDTGPDTGCENEGDIDDLRFDIVAETCNWLVFDCGHMEQNFLGYCASQFSDGLIPPVEAGDCVDWCGARSYVQRIREQDCSLAEPYVDDGSQTWDEYFAPVREPALEHFYTCETPNYEPSGP